MAGASCSQCARIADSRSLLVCPVCRGYYCASCMPRHRMECGCNVQAMAVTHPI